MSDVLTINVGPTRCYIEYGTLSPHFKHRLVYELKQLGRKHLTNFKYEHSKQLYTVSAEFFRDDVVAETWYFPRPFLLTVMDHLNGLNLGLQIDQVTRYAPTPRAHNFKMSSTFAPRDYQLPAIKFLTENKNGRCGLELQTGKGKTACSIKAAEELGSVTLIVVNGLSDQWLKAFKTHAPSANVYVIEGHDSLVKLFKKEYVPDVFIATIQTLRLYALREGNYANLISYNEFIQHFGIGTKIVDEAHQCLHANAIVDMAGDIATNIYLTATFDTGDRMLKRIFHTYFPNQMRYDNGYERYTDVIGYSYRSNIPPKKTVFMGAYSHFRFEKMLLWSKKVAFVTFMERMVMPLINQHYFRKTYPGKKAVVFFALKQMIREAQLYLQARYPELKVVTFIDNDPEENLDVGDIILSTHKGMGTGRDVPNLILVINTVSHMSAPAVVQLLGRLRKLPGGSIPVFCDMYDVNNPSHIRHWHIRSRILAGLAREYRELQL